MNRIGNYQNQFLWFCNSQVWLTVWRGERVDPNADYGDRIEFLTNVNLLFLAVQITNKKQMEIELKLTRPKLGGKNKH